MNKYKNKTAAERLNISAAYLRKLTQEGLITASHQTAGGHKLYTEEDLVAARAIVEPGADLAGMRAQIRQEREQRLQALHVQYADLSSTMWKQYGQLNRGLHRVQMAAIHALPGMFLVPLVIWALNTSGFDLPGKEYGVRQIALGFTIFFAIGLMMPWSKLPYTSKNSLVIRCTWDAIRYRRDYEPTLWDSLTARRFRKRSAAQRELANELVLVDHQIAELEKSLGLRKN